MTNQSAQPTVSIQIPCYMQEAYIEKTIASALAQTYENLEVVVLDDCSTDKSFALISAIKDRRLKVYRNEKNIGRVKNYQKLLFELVHGDWVVNLDGDDAISDNHFIERGIEMLLQQPEAVLYQSNNQHIEKMDTLPDSRRLDKNHLHCKAIPYLLSYNEHRGFNHMACIYDRKVAIACNFYSMPSLNTDFHSMMKLGKHGSFIFSNFIIGKWKLNEQSASNKIIDASEHALNQEAMHSLATYYADQLNEQQLKNLEKELFELQEYYLFQSLVLLSDKSTALYHLRNRFSFSKDYFMVLAMFIRKLLFT